MLVVVVLEDENELWTFKMAKSYITIPFFVKNYKKEELFKEFYIKLEFS